MHILAVDRADKRLIRTLYTWKYGIGDERRFPQFRRFREGQVVARLAPNVFLMDDGEDTLRLLEWYRARHPNTVKIFKVEETKEHAGEGFEPSTSDL